VLVPLERGRVKAGYSAGRCCKTVLLTENDSPIDRAFRRVYSIFCGIVVNDVVKEGTFTVIEDSGAEHGDGVGR